MGFIDTIAISSAVPTTVIPLAVGGPFSAAAIAGVAAAVAFGAWVAAKRWRRPMRRSRPLRLATAS
jgi:membrane associated rhomboid family serine protease